MSAQRRRMSRARILDGATEILDSGLYGDLTVDALARVLHMSKSTLYKHFTSKEDLVVSLVEDACSETENALRESVDAQNGEPTDALRALVEVYAEHADRLPRAAIVQQRRLPEACQLRVQLTDSRVADVLRTLMNRGNSSGEFKTSTPELVAEALMASSRAAMEAAARGDLEVGRGEAVRSLLPLFMPGLAD